MRERVRSGVGPWAAALLIAATAAGAGPPGNGGKGEAAAGDAAAALDARVRDHLAAGRIDAALRAAQRALARHPDDPDVRERFVSVHLSLARGLIAEEAFSEAERALAAVLKVDEDQPEARRLSREIRSARARVPRRVAQAREWIALEWFEPAFTALRQAGALRPSEEADWARAWRAAALGAGDDDYFSKNFHEAFYYYDAALRIGDDLGLRPTSSLISRWMQCMAHALAADIEQARYPPAYWKMALRRAEGLRFDGASAAELRALLRGLAHENLGAPERAAAAYGRVLGRPVVSLDASLVAKGRAAALRSIRRWYDVGLSDRREGIWTHRDAGDWRVWEVPGFRIHHRNAEAAGRVARAAAFHFRRIAGLLALDVAEVPWPIACDVYLHADAAAFRAATGQTAESVRAISVMETRADPPAARLTAHSIHLHQRDPLLLSASLSHELAHLMVGAATGYRPAPAALREGLALHVEPRCRHRQFARLFGRVARPRRLGRLLSLGELHPADADFYAEAYRLVSVLRRGGDLSEVLAAAGGDANRAALARRFGYRTGRALEAAYRGNAETPRP